MDRSSDEPATTSATESSEDLAVPRLQTLQNIYRQENLKRDSSVRRSLNREAYNKLQKSSCSSVSHSSVSVLKNRFEAQPETAIDADKSVQTVGNESAVKNSADKEKSISDCDKVAKKEKPAVPKKPVALKTVDEVSKLQKSLKTSIFDDSQPKLGSSIPVRTSPVKRLSSIEIHLQPYTPSNTAVKKADPLQENSASKEVTTTSNLELQLTKKEKASSSLELRPKTEETKATTPKRVSFSSEVCRIPVPAPRKKLEQVDKPIEVVKVEVKTVEKETVTPVLLVPEKSDVNSNYLQTADIDLDSIDFAEPEDKHIIARGSSENILEKINSDLDSFVMDDKREKKRTNSFKKIWKGGIFKKRETKKAENVDNAQNESFNRSSTLRHTVDGHQKNCEYDLERRYAQMHINKFNQAKANFASEDYVCMDNGNRVNKYIDTSSSSNTLDSENCSYEQRGRDSDNSSNQEKPLNTNVVLRNKFFDSGTPPRAQDTYQNVQLVKPKALIPINSERPLPNPYQDKPIIERNLNGQFRDRPQGYTEDIYGTVYDKKLVVRQPSPDIRSQCSDGSANQPSRSPSLEGSKLKLPANREKVELQPRIRSPIPQAAVSTDKIIATELLKTRGKKDERPWSPSHQRLEIEFDYPEQQVDSEPKGKPPISPQSKTVQSLEAAEWHRKQRMLSQSPAMTNSQITTNVVVHVENRSSTPIQDRSITPVMRNPPVVQRSPPKHEIRQSVEAFCWKELKKLKEAEDRQLQMQISMTPFGYAEEPIIAHRSRSMSPNFQRNTRRSSSLPRDVLRQRRLEEAPRRPQNQNFVRGSPQRSTIEISTQRPIFNRGSLTQQFNQMEPQSLYNKKVSFHAAQNTQQVWPTKNGFTQSPPQRRIDIKRSTSENDDVFLPNTPKEPVYDARFNLSREEIFHLNQQKQRQMKEEAERRQGNFNFRPLPNEPGYQNGDYGYSKGGYAGRPMMPNINENEPMYIDRGYIAKQPEPIYVTRQAPGNGFRYPQEQREPLYGRTGPPRRATVNNKVCDIYGKIHDNPTYRATPQSQGVLYGQLKRNTNAPPLQYQSYDHLRNSNFIRGTRLTASVNDMDRRFQMDPRFEPPNRPLPPLPHDQRTRLAMMRRQPPSDTESNASELQRIYTTSREPPPMKNRSIVGK